MGITQTTALRVIASTFLSQRRPGLHGSTARAPGTQLCSRPRSSGQGVFVAPVLRPRRAGWWVGCPLPCPRLASQLGSRWPREQGPGQATGPLDGPAHTTQTLMAWWPPHSPAQPRHPCSGPKLWNGVSPLPVKSQAYGDPVTCKRLQAGAEWGQEPLASLSPLRRRSTPRL